MNWNPFKRADLNLDVPVAEIVSCNFDGYTNRYHVEALVHGGAATWANVHKNYQAGGRIKVQNKELLIVEQSVSHEYSVGAFRVDLRCVDLNLALAGLVNSHGEVTPAHPMTTFNPMPPPMMGQIVTGSTVIPMSALPQWPVSTYSTGAGAAPPWPMPPPSTVPSTLAVDANRSRKPAATFGPTRRKLLK